MNGRGGVAGMQPLYDRPVLIARRGRDSPRRRGDTEASPVFHTSLQARLRIQSSTQGKTVCATRQGRSGRPPCLRASVVNGPLQRQGRRSDGPAASEMAVRVVVASKAGAVTGVRAASASALG